MTRGWHGRILGLVLAPGRFLLALLLTLALSAGDPALCAGWIAAPDLQMACCADDQTCPMHAPDAEGAGSTHHDVRHAADNCCMASGQADARPIAATTVVSPSHGVVTCTDSHLRLPPTSAGPARTLARSPGPHVPRHVLLSVFLV